MKKCVGFDFGNHAVHVAVNNGGKIVRSITERLPEGLVLDGRITSVESMVDVIREIKRKHKPHAKNAAVVLPAGQCYCRRFTVAAMTKKELLFNLPYDFHDFISDDKSNYYFDYAVVEAKKDGNGNVTEFDIMAAATRKDLVADYIAMFRKAGFKLVTVVPQEIAYINLIRRSSEEEHKHGILDIGYNGVRLYLFSGDKYDGVRTVEYGCDALASAIAENFGIEGNFVAATYLETNFEHSCELPACKDIYKAIAIEVLKAVNFYKFNDGAVLEHIHCCGGGSRNRVFMDTLREELGLSCLNLSEFFPYDKNVDYRMVAAAAGATFD